MVCHAKLVLRWEGCAQEGGAMGGCPACSVYRWWVNGIWVYHIRVCSGRVCRSRMCRIRALRGRVYRIRAYRTLCPAALGCPRHLLARSSFMACVARMPARLVLMARMLCMLCMPCPPPQLVRPKSFGDVLRGSKGKGSDPPAAAVATPSPAEPAAPHLPANKHVLRTVRTMHSRESSG